MNRKDVVGALIRKDGKVLLAQRSDDELDRKWEFPGGKVEDNETHETALKREIQEELGISIAVQERVGYNHFEIRGKPYTLHCYWADIVEGEPTAGEHHRVLWVAPAELLDYDLAPADVPIAQEVVANDR
ncbi:(deoxy)nucleoside triphosphate pyrophosphohydrolase [Thermodesulfobacteriota bacterium]